MTEKLLADMLRLISIAKTGNSFTAEQLNSMHQKVSGELYAARIKQFKRMVDRALPDMPNDTEVRQQALNNAMDDFYDKSWTITFNGMSVTIENDATIYNGMLDTLNEIIDYCL